MSVRMRHTSSHTRNRRSHHALSASTLVTDKESGKLRQPHRLDESTGMYRGIQIISKKDLARAEKKEAKKAAHKHEHIHAEGVKEPVHAEKHTAAELKAAQEQATITESVMPKAKTRSQRGTNSGK